MPRAIPGAPYTVVSGDTLTGIAKQAYGDPKKWRDIWQANQSSLRSGDPNLIYPGEILQIPPDTLQSDVLEELGLPGSDELLPGKDPEDFTVIINNTEVICTSGRVLRTMDTVTDGFTAELLWDPTDADFTELVKPYGYQDVKVYVGQYLVITGRIYNPRPKLSPDGNVLVLEGYSLTADCADSTLSANIPPEKAKLTLKQRAEDLLKPLGLKTVFEVDEGEAFDRITAEPEDTIFEHLATLATQRSVLISSTIKGEVIFYQTTTAPPAGVLEEEFPPYQSLEASFDGRKRFNSYRAICPTPKKMRKKGGTNMLEAVAKDETVPKSRFQTFRAHDATAGNIQSVAEWRRSKQVAESLTIPFPVSSWYTADGDLWRENTLVTVKSPTIFVPNGFDFLIKSVEYIFDANGTTAILTLVPPEVYTGGEIDEPWL